MEWVTLIAFGAIVGFGGGYAGIGGAPLLVAGLVLALGKDQHLAQGTILAVMLAPMSLPGVVVMRDRVRLLLPHNAMGVGTYAVFSNLGARLAYSLDREGLTLAFAALLILLGLHYVTRRERAGDAVALDPNGPTVTVVSRVPFSVLSVGVIGAGVGVAGGLFGIGAGVLMVPILISAVGLHKDDARALSKGERRQQKEGERRRRRRQQRGVVVFQVCFLLLLFSSSLSLSLSTYTCLLLCNNTKALSPFFFPPSNLQKKKKEMHNKTLKSCP